MKAHADDRKNCTGCGDTKPLSEFHRHRSGLHPRCRTCLNTQSRNYHRKHRDRVKARSAVYRAEHRELINAKQRSYYAANASRIRIKKLLVSYGLTEAAYAELLRKQNSGCAICGQMNGSHGRPILDVDHDHDNGAVRGLLCNHCNTALGNFFDRIDLLERAASYLKRPHLVESLR